MTSLVTIEATARRLHLALFGAFHLGPDDGLGSNFQTLLMFGPAEPGYWAHVTGSAEWQDGGPDPIDRWSARVLGALAAELDGQCFFPSDGPPYYPVYQWALRTGRAWVSPVTLLVHDAAGLFVSYRGAIAVKERLALPAPPPKPCDSCPDRPCLAACPAGALTDQGYDLAACHAWLDRLEGADCLSCGCRARRACPRSQAYGRLPEQSAYHMRLFHK
ncbi:MAG: ferredoxin [Paracoccaceae bacterium]